EPGLEREPQPGPHGQPGRRPPPPITTDAAQVALRIEQRLLDDLRRTVNAIAAHVNGATSSGTDLVIPWLEETVLSARRLDPAELDPDGNPARKKTVPGTGLPALLHEDPGTGDVKRCLPGDGTPTHPDGGRGVVDRQAAAKARDYLARDAVPAQVLAALS